MSEKTQQNTIWQIPPVIKIYEALGSIGDKRIEIEGNTAKVYSSSRNKYYDVIYDPESNAITANDNGSYWKGYLGYPSIAFLMTIGKIRFNTALATYLSDFAWKDINTKYKNDFEKTEQYIREEMVKRHNVDLQMFDNELAKIMQQIDELKLNKLKTNAKPPEGY